jgi:hypothetical protein
MRLFFRIIIGLLIIWFGFRAITQAYAPIQSGLFSELQYVSLTILIIATIVALLLDTKYFKNNHKIYQYIMSFIGLILCGVVTLKYMHNNNIDNSNTLIRVSNLPGATNVLSFDFKDNGNFRLTKYDKLGETIYYGKYSKVNDTINIINTNNEVEINNFPKWGFIENDTIYWYGFDEMVVDKK